MPRKKPAKPLHTGPHEGSREDYLVRALAQLEKQVKSAEKDRSWTAAVQAKKAAVQVRADLDQLRETERRQAAPSSAADHKAEILAEVRRLRQGATEAGSYVAAATLLKLERDFLSAAHAEERQANADALAKASVADLQAEVEELLKRSGRPGPLAH
jgi:hypothetical protein